VAQLAQLAQLGQLGRLVVTVVTVPPRPSLPIASALRGSTRLLILQGTPFCNIACDYCYLPDRADRKRMPHDTVEAAADWIFRHQLPAPGMTVVWHCGEPLVLPPGWYEEAFARIGRAAARHGATPPQHGIQTNAMLINDSWCELFMTHRVRIGVSLDGPIELHDARRKNRAGAGTHAQVMRGIARLQAERIPFNTICVLTRASLDQPRELIDFFADHGILDLAFNLEEVEGINTHSTLVSADIGPTFREFYSGALHQAARRGVRLRDLQLITGLLADPDFGSHRHNDQNGPFRIVSVTADGNLHTYSPELAGFAHPQIGALAIGNVARNSLEDVLRHPAFSAQWHEVEAGIDACIASECLYFRLCRGGAPSNKLAEHGTFAAADTLFCQLSQKTTADAVLGALEAALARKPGLPPRPIAAATVL
jgi:uncharacterized protein